MMFPSFRKGIITMSLAALFAFAALFPLIPIIELIRPIWPEAYAEISKRHPGNVKFLISHGERKGDTPAFYARYLVFPANLKIRVTQEVGSTLSILEEKGAALDLAKMTAFYVIAIFIGLKLMKKPNQPVETTQAVARPPRLT